MFESAGQNKLTIALNEYKSGDTFTYTDSNMYGHAWFAIPN